MRKTARRPVDQNEKELVKLIESASESRHIWQTWQDMVTAIACSICNAVDRTPERFQRREEQYAQAVKNLGGVEKPARMLDIVTMALEQNPDQDFLGKVYMNLNLGNHWRGQFFTPYSISRMMAEINLGKDRLQAEVEEKGYLSVCDPCVGAGAMLIAAANAIRRAGVNYQVHTVFVGQDVDQIVAMMAYIQLSLLGCPGYIIIGDSLVNPPTGHVLFPQEKKGQEIWITPFFTHQTWEMRRTWIWMQELFRTTETTKKTAEKEHFFMFFDFDRQEVSNGNELH